MSVQERAKEIYPGFEQGPIRPPSEAHSLLIRVTRNCPWNRCTFCPVYKGRKFSRRPVSHVKEDIDSVYKHVEALRQITDLRADSARDENRKVARRVPPSELSAFNAACHWYFSGGMKSVFLQDADALVVKPRDLAAILLHLRKRFPSVERITAYSRSRTIASRKDSDLEALAAAGLNRLHVGLESGSDRVLERAAKGVTKEKHIAAGLKVKRAGIELSEYIMPGLGGRELSEVHAAETADAVNRIDPDFIRLRTLAIPHQAPLFEEYTAGRFQKCTDQMVAKEILLFIESLRGITSIIKSDHILNLFGDLEGVLPQDRDHLMGMLRSYLKLDPEQQRLYQVGRRLGMFCGIGDMDNVSALGEAKRVCGELGVTAENVDRITDELMTRYV